MAVKPIVRYMILCHDWKVDATRPNRVNILGLLSNIRSGVVPRYPMVFRELCVFLALTEARGTGTAQIICVVEETGQRIFSTPQRRVTFGSDPLEIVGVPFRIRDCRFPFEGLYSVQFWYDGEQVDERPLRLR